MIVKIGVSKLMHDPIFTEIDIILYDLIRSSLRKYSLADTSYVSFVRSR